MSLVHAILGFLHHHPMTGYDLKTTAFDVSVAHFWPADQAQIYRTLDRLHEQGLVTSTLEVQTDRPNRKVYALTPAGEAELRRWLEETQSLPVYREPFLIQVFFGDLLPNAALEAHLHEQYAQHAARLKTYEEIGLPAFDTPGLPRSLRLQRFALDLGIRLEQAYLGWLAESLARLESLPDRDGEAGTTDSTAAGE